MHRKAFKYLLGIVFVLVLNGCGAEISMEMKTEDVKPLAISAETMLADIAFLSETDNARMTGFEGERKAGDFLIQEFEDLGFEVTTQEFPVIAYLLSETKLMMDDKAIENVKALSYSTFDEIPSAPIIHLGMGLEADYSGQDATGKIALIERGEETFQLKTQRAAEAGALAVIFFDRQSIRPILATLVELSEIPAVSVGSIEGLAVIETLNKGGTVSASLSVLGESQKSTSRNIIGTYKSENNTSGKKVILGAHYDGVDTPAANDNASGTAVILELARNIKANQLSLPFDIEFIGFGAEEIGLVGSSHYVENINKIEEIIGVLNFDMVGVGNIINVSNAESRRFPKWSDLAKSVLEKQGVTYHMATLGRSDHVPFAEQNIPAVMINTTPYTAYHTDDDIAETIDKDLLLKVCHFALEFVKSIEIE